MISLALLLVGMVGVAALIAAAAQMQKRTFEDVRLHQYATSASATISAIRVRDRVGDVPPRTHVETPTPWIPERDGFVARTLVGHRHVYLLIVDAGASLTTSAVLGADGPVITLDGPARIEPGEIVLDEHGNIHSVQQVAGPVVTLSAPPLADPTRLYHAAGGRCRRIVPKLM